MFCMKLCLAPDMHSHVALQGREIGDLHHQYSQLPLTGQSPQPVALHSDTPGFQDLPFGAWCMDQAAPFLSGPAGISNQIFALMIYAAQCRPVVLAAALLA